MVEHHAALYISFRSNLLLKKSMHLKWTILWVLTSIYNLCDPNFYQDREHALPSQLRTCLQNTVLIFSETNAVNIFFLVLPVLELSIIGLIQNVLLCSASYTQQNVFEIRHVVISICFFSSLSCFPLYDYHTLVTYCPIDRLLGCLQFLAMINKTAMHILYQSFYGHVLSFLLGKYIGTELLGQKYV